MTRLIKKLFPAILLVACQPILFLIAVVVGARILAAQSEPPSKQEPAAAEAAEAAVPVVKPEVAAPILANQVAEARILLRMKDIQQEFLSLNQEIQRIRMEGVKLVQEAPRRSGLSHEKWVLNAEKMKFEARTVVSTEVKK